uniref:Tau-tubulin kinase 1 n=1 Tax=Ascaris suum TaxID=6253 RepID=F1LAH2_ASCSU
MISAESKYGDCFPKNGAQIEGKSGTYTVVKLLGSGGFGAVFQVRCNTSNELYAAKCEAYDHPRKVLLMECKVLRGAELLNSPHFCKIYEVGKVEGKFRFMITTMIGSTLYTLRMNRIDKRFSLGTSLRMAQQCLEALQDMHTIGFIHRDIKPSNFGIGRPETNDYHIVYVIDFGLSRQFANADKDIRKPRLSAPFRGTPRYASLNCHRKREQSPKDDIESWFYMIVEWTAGSLPWRHFQANERDQILLMKEDARKPIAMNFFLEKCPKRHYEKIFKYIDTLVYTSIPDYAYIYFLLKHAAKVNHIEPNEPLDYDPFRPYHGTETPLSSLPAGTIVEFIEQNYTTEIK